MRLRLIEIEMGDKEGQTERKRTRDEDREKKRWRDERLDIDI